MDLLKQYQLYKTGSLELSVLCGDIKKCSNTQLRGRSLSLLIMDQHPADLLREVPELEFTLARAFEQNELTPEAMVLYSAFIHPHSQIHMGKIKPLGSDRKMLKPARALPRSVDLPGFDNHIWETETVFFLNQLLESLLTTPDLDAAIPVLNTWYAEIITAFRGGHISIDARLALAAYLRALTQEEEQENRPGELVMDRLHHGVWYQQDFSRELEAEFGINPLAQAVSSRVVKLYRPGVNIRDLSDICRGLEVWLNQDRLPKGYDLSGIKRALNRLWNYRNREGEYHDEDWCFSALFGQDRLLAFSSFERRGDDWVQRDGAASPQMHRKDGLSWPELLALWQMLIRESHAFPRGRRVVVNTAGQRSRAALYQRLFFRTMARDEGFHSLKDQGAVSQFYKRCLWEKLETQMEYVLPSLKGQIHSMGLEMEFQYPIDMLEIKLLDIKSLLETVDVPTVEMRLGSQLAVLERQSREIGLQVSLVGDDAFNG